MKVKVLILVFIVVCKALVYCQEEKKNDFSIYVGSGLMQHTTNDQLLNYYRYSGNRILPLSLSCLLDCNKNLFIINLFYNTAKLKPFNLTSNYYAYNYIDLWNMGLGLEYFRKISGINNSVRFFFGVGDHSYISVQQENYKSLLYEYAEGFRRSYDISLISLSPMFLAHFRLKKNSIMIKTAYSLLHFAARPDDDYVKQIGLKENYHWNLYSLKKYKNVLFSVFYQYRLFKNFGITAECNVFYRSYSSPCEYKYLQKSYLAGIFKSF
jgi:hypothetical protein